MSTAVIDFPVTTEIEEEAAKRKAEAQKHFSIIKKSWSSVRSNSLRIGFHAAILKRQNLFGILGFQNESEAREAAEVGESTWYANIAIAEAFEGLEEETFCAFKQANAKAATDLPLSKRMDPFWIKKIQTDPIEAFALAVDEEMDGKAKASDGKERTVSMKLSMPKSRKKAIETGLQEISKEYGCDGDESRTLELLVAEKTGTPSLMATLVVVAERCKDVKNLLESGLSSDEVLAKVVILNEQTILEIAAALNSVQNLELEQ